jgi:hypothetical protein
MMGFVSSSARIVTIPFFRVRDLQQLPIRISFIRICPASSSSAHSPADTTHLVSATRKLAYPLSSSHPFTVGPMRRARGCRSAAACCWKQPNWLQASSSKLRHNALLNLLPCHSHCPNCKLAKYVLTVGETEFSLLVL